MQSAKDQWDSPSNYDFLEAWGMLSPEEREEIPASFRAKCENRVTVLLASMGKNGHDVLRKLPQPLDWAQLEGTEPPARQWATTSWFGFGHVTLMVGAGGIGKTLCAQQWAAALAIGADFIDTTPRPLNVLMWACEDDGDELHRRQCDIAAWLKQPLSAFKPNLNVVPRHGEENTLMSLEFGRPIFTSVLKDLREQAGDHRADVVILDNAAQLYGGNENARHDVTLFMNRLSGELPGKAIMLLAHPSRAAGSEFSGSGAWEAVARTRLYLGRKLPDQPDEGGSEDDVTRYLCRRKANYSARDYRRFDYNNGVLVQDVTEGAGGLIGSIRKRKALEVLIDGLKRLTEKGVRTTDGKTSPQYLPRVLVDYELNDGLAIRDLGDAMRQAVMSGRIERGVIGKYENRTPMYGLKVTVNGAQT